MLEKNIQISNGTEIQLMYDPVLVKEVINQDWDSLYFSKNDATFATMKTESALVTVVTNGDVKIFNLETNERLINNDQNKIKELIDELHTHTRVFKRELVC